MAVTTPWSPCLAAGLGLVAVGSSLATTVSDTVLLARCYARRRHLRSATGGGLLAAAVDGDDDDDDDDADEFTIGASSSVTFGGGTQKRYDWLAVMRLGAGGVGMALIAVLLDQILA
jgi:hypothetical protein